MTEPSDQAATGFGEASIEAAEAFRAILTALAQPGRLVDLPARLVPPHPLARTTAAVLLTLVDGDTPLWLDPALREPAVTDWLRFHTGAPILPDLAAARFAVVGEPQRFAEWARLAVGTPEYPDTSATLVLQVAELGGGHGARLSGPGIAGEARLSARPLPDGFWAAQAANHALYPLGFDVLLAGPGQVAGLPRSTRCQAPEKA